MRKEKKEITLTHEVIINKLGQMRFLKSYSSSETYNHFRYLKENKSRYIKLNDNKNQHKTRLGL